MTLSEQKSYPILEIDINDFSKRSGSEKETILRRVQEIVESCTDFFMPYTNTWDKWIRHGTGDGYYFSLDRFAHGHSF